MTAVISYLETALEATAVNMIRNAIKARPRLYDLVNNLRPPSTPTEVWVNQFSQRLGRPAVFVQVGASDGLRWDPFRRFILRDRWTGVLIEPLPRVFDLLRRNYSHKTRQGLAFVNAAITYGGGDEVTFYTLSDAYLDRLTLEDQLFWLRKATLEKDHLLQHVGGASIPTEHVIGVRVPCVSLKEIVTRHMASENLDIVLSDAEGHDDQVIYSLELDAIRPGVILFESHNLGVRYAPLLRFLEERGYVVKKLGGDAVAIRSDMGDGGVPVEL